MSEINPTDPFFNADISSSVNNAFQNLTDKPTKTIGNLLSDLFYLVFGDISYKAEQKRIKHAVLLEQYKCDLEEAISSIPPEKRVDPSFQVAAQALENSKYCIEEAELKEMFISLISNSMNSDYANLVHPSYSEIIKQMSVLDAKIIRLFKEKEIFYTGFPVCQYCFKFSDIQTLPMPEHIFLELPDTDVKLCSQSLSSLSRFGIVSITYSKHFTAPNIYDKFLQHTVYTELNGQLPFGDISLSKGIVELTPLGRSFVTVCIPD